jgi:hypothetical protein
LLPALAQDTANHGGIVLGMKCAFRVGQARQTRGKARMKRFFRYTTLEILIAATFIGLFARSLFPTVSRAVSSILHAIPWNL